MNNIQCILVCTLNSIPFTQSVGYPISLPYFSVWAIEKNKVDGKYIRTNQQDV
jgi:hypothetical protein